MRYVWLTLVLAAVAAVRAAEEPLADGLKTEEDNRLWYRMIDSLGVLADEDMSYATMFSPTDRAVNVFLTEMGLTFDELLARPVLVDQIVSYHLVPGATIKNFYVKKSDSKDLISSNAAEPTTIFTGDVNSVIQAFKSPITGLIALVDTQGNQAVVVGSGNSYSKIEFWDISAVLMSDSYFYNAQDAIRMYPQWSAAGELLSKAALYSQTLEASLIGSAESTWLLPNNDALQSVARPLVNAPAEDLAKVMEYHVIAGLKPVPKGWTNGAAVETKLAQQTIKAVLTTTQEQDPYTGENVTAPLLTLVPAAGLPARVTVYNIFAGKSIILALDQPLLPSFVIAKNLLAAAKLGGTGRRLLQSNRRSHANNWSAQNTQRAIRAAARGDIPVSYATRAGTRNAQLARGGCVNCLRWAQTW